jgi:hypothetical protein
MKMKILSSEKITKKIVYKELSCSTILTKEETNEYLDIISAINNGESVYNLITNKGEYLFYIKNDKVIKNVKHKS